MKINNSNKIIAKFKDLLIGATGKTKLLTDQFCSVLKEIPELISFINEDNKNIEKVILGELSQNMEIKEYNTGNYLKKLLGNNDNFYMVLSGKILEIEIKYIKTNMTFKDYILFLTKLYLLKEEYLYKDCFQRNNEAFPLHKFCNYKKNNMKLESEKNEVECTNDTNDINIIALCNDINTKDFNFKEELKNIKNDIRNSAWKKRKQYLKGENPNYEFIIDSFLNLYNYNVSSNNKIVPNVTKYVVQIPFFFKKEILEPISFIGSLNRPHKMKNFKGYLCLSDSFVIYLDKNLLKKNNSLYKYSNKKKCEVAIEKLFKTHYIFKNINIEFLKTNFGKYLEMYTLKKNDILFKQNEPHKGIYIITNGSFQLKTCQTYNQLNDLNYILLHSLDSYPSYVSEIKNKIINNKVKSNYEDKMKEKKVKKNEKNYLFGYYDYNSDKNNIMKNPIFSEKAKEKNEIIFCVYKINDILGLGEIYNNKTNLNTFTAECISDEAELFFIRNEIFNGLLSDDNIYEKCGIIIEGKVNTFIRCISKYKYIFEKKIEYLINNKNKKKRICLSGKNKQIRNYNNIIQKINKINDYKVINNSHSDYNLLRQNDINVKISNDESINNNNINNNKIIDHNNNKEIQKIIEDNNKNYIPTVNNEHINSPKEKQKYSDFKQNEEVSSDKIKSLIMPNISISNKNKKNNIYALGESSTSIDKNKSVSESNKHNNKTLFLANKNIKNQKAQILQTSLSFMNNNAGIKQRMEEMSKYYSGNIFKKGSGPIIISYKNDIYSKNNNKNINTVDRNIFFEENKKLKLKLSKEIIPKRKERCLSAQRYSEKSKSGGMPFENKILVKNIYPKVIEDTNKNYNIAPFTSRKTNFINKNILNNNKAKKITINKFLPTTLFPNFSNSKDKLD